MQRGRDKGLMITADQIVDRLQAMGRKPCQNGQGWIALCPAHDDHDPSLSINRADDGKPLLYCHAGCQYEAIVKALGLEANEPMHNRRKYSSSPSGQIVDTYDYEDECGNLLYQTVRYEPKGFRQRRPDGNDGWIWNLKGVGRILYRLPELFEDLGMDRRIYIVEGEKDADRLRSEGLASTCNVGGAGKWQKEYSKTLKGAKVCILPDNDDPGRKHAQKAAQSLHGIAAEVRVLGLPRLPEKGDVSNWLGNGGTAEELERLANEAACWKSNAMQNAGESRFTDAGNAERLVSRHGKDIRYVAGQNSWYVWHERRWEKASPPEIIDLALKTIRHIYREAAEVDDKSEREALIDWARRSESRQKLEAMASLARGMENILIKPNQVDSDPELLNVLNGTIDLQKCALREHRRADLITKIAPVEYDPDARLELWEDFLAKATAGDKELADFLQQAAGYSLTGDNSEEILFFIYGPTASGKSTFAEAIKATLGNYAVTADFKTFLRKKGFDGPRPDIARLAGSRLILSSEVDEGSALAIGIIKMITGGDTLVARFLYQEEFEFRQVGTLWLIANHAPKVPSDEEATWRRILRIPFEKTIPRDDRDPKVKKALTNPKSAGPAILAWAMQGYRRWKEQGKLLIPEAVKKSTEAYRQEVDPLHDFIQDRCTIKLDDPGCREPSSALWEAYQEWATESGIKYPVKRPDFGKRLKTFGLQQAQVGEKRTRVYQGITLRMNGGEQT